MLLTPFYCCKSKTTSFQYVGLSAQLIPEVCGPSMIYPYPDLTICGTHPLSSPFLMSGRWEVPDRPLCTANRWGYWWWQKAWTGMPEPPRCIVLFIQVLYVFFFSHIKWSYFCLCLIGELPKGILCILTNVTTSKQRRLLQDIVKHGHSTCTRGHTGECRNLNI